jgi:predicted  nucleic acid-binding Zn-ribbon protein
MVKENKDLKIVVRKLESHIEALSSQRHDSDYKTYQGYSEQTARRLDSDHPSNEENGEALMVLGKLADSEQITFLGQEQLESQKVYQTLSHHIDDLQKIFETQTMN